MTIVGSEGVHFGNPFRVPCGSTGSVESTALLGGNDDCGLRGGPFGGPFSLKTLPGGALFPLHFRYRFLSRFGALLALLLDVFWLPV